MGSKNMSNLMKKRVGRFLYQIAVLVFLLGLPVKVFGTIELSPRLSHSARDEAMRGGRPILPAPVFNMNQKVELADGELYVLCGTVVDRGGVASFKVDLRTHSWLASAKRVSSPYYDLAIDPVIAKELFNQRVQVTGHARGRVISAQPGILDYLLILEPVENGVNVLVAGECPAPKGEGSNGQL